MRRCAEIMGCRTLAVLASVALVAGCGSSRRRPRRARRQQPRAPPARASTRPSGRKRRRSATRRASPSCRGTFPFPAFDPTQPDPTKFPAIAAYEAKTDAAMRTWQAALHALGQPRTGSGVWTRFLGFVDRNVTSEIAQHRAAQRHESAAFTQTYRDLSGPGPGGRADRRGGRAAVVRSGQSRRHGNGSAGPPPRRSRQDDRRERAAFPGVLAQPWSAGAGKRSGLGK